MTGAQPSTPPPQRPGGDPWAVARLTALAWFMGRERAIYQAYRGWVDRWLDFIRPRVLTGHTIDPHGVYSGGPVFRDGLRGFLTGGILPTLRDAYTTAWHRATRGRPPHTVFDTMPFTRQYLAQVENKMVGIVDEVFDEVRADVDVGIREGLGIPQIADRIRGTLLSRDAPVWVSRGTTVARTETVGANNGGQFAAYTAVSAEDRVEFFKTWLATDDARTRHTHRDADGQRVPLAGVFMLGKTDTFAGWPALHPGAKTLPPEESINCRCTVLYLREGEQV